jgi:hypothetical protein
MAGAVFEGYAAVTTDAGLGVEAPPLDPSAWALRSPGNVNWDLVHNFGSRALDEAVSLPCHSVLRRDTKQHPNQAIIAKSLTKDYYGTDPRYSYFSGCSQGGRQGLVLAQKYPEQYDGILAGAPAIDFPSVVMNMHLPFITMAESNDFPAVCEFEAILEATTAACDGLDGVVDGLITDMVNCRSLTHVLDDLVGKEIDCPSTGGKRTISKTAVAVIKATWEGILDPTTSKRLLPGFNPGTILHQGIPGAPPDPAFTHCSEQEGTCTAAPQPFAASWMRYFALKNPDVEVSKIRMKEFIRLLKQSKSEYRTFFINDDEDLSDLKAAGGKMLTWHGQVSHAVA